MRIYFVGGGERLEHFRDALAANHLQPITVEEDASKVRFGTDERPVEKGDLIIVTDSETPPIRNILDNLSRQNLAATVMVFTASPNRALARLFPSFLFRDERDVYRNELRELQRRAAGLQRVEAIRDAARKARIVTLIWGNPDPDALASACALQDLVADAASSFTIAYLGEFTRPENAAMVNLLKIPTRKFSPDLIAPPTVLATVDAQPSFFKSDGRLKFDIVIDHHPVTDLSRVRFADVRPTYGSASTILTEYYQASGATLSKRVATALFYGLKTDTGNLTRNVSDADVAAFRYLRVRADENLIRTIELSHLPVETLDYIATAIANKIIVKDVAFAYLGTIPNSDLCVPVADFFMGITGVAWVIVTCRWKDRIIVIFRSDGLRKHAGRMAESLFLEYGSAGGHRTMARAELDLSRLGGELRETTDVAIEDWLLARLSKRLRPMARPSPVKTAQ